MDYSADFLEARTPISFHKHWMCDPKAVYADLMKERDDIDRQTNKRGTTTTETSAEKHIEL